MKLVLLSGGSGKRLWPLSNDSRSKQFLKVLEGEEDNSFESMVQRVWRQLKQSKLAGNAVIATSKAQVEMIQNQIGSEIPLVVEPSRRDTFPAIALAASYLYSILQTDIDEIVTILPVDPYVSNDFFENLKKVENLIQKKNADICLIGVTPTYPSSKYGYILPYSNSLNEEEKKVKKFVEKPSEQVAEELISNGALWNCGVFGFKLRYILNILEEKNLPIDYNELVERYTELPKISFDYEVVEKSNNIIVTPYSGYWKDLGTWNTLTEEMKSSQIGKGVLSADSIDTHLINELDIPITVLGVNNLVIAASPDGILVSNKDVSPKIKEYIGVFENRPMYEERRWGWYKVLDYTKYEDGNEALTKRICIKSGKNLSYQYHTKRLEVWTILKGEGLVAINGNIRSIKVGDIIQINYRDIHAIKALTDIEFIEVQKGSELIEEDIVRISNKWDEIEDIVKLNS